MNENKKSILVIDDAGSLRDAIETALTYEGFKVYTAEDGEEGLKLAFEHKPDLIFLDIIMPNIDGVEVLNQLRADEWGKDADVVVMTVVDDVEKIAEVLQKGGNDYMLKTEVSLRSIIEKAKEKLGDQKADNGIETVIQSEAL